jgi:hypothetical protein
MIRNDIEGALKRAKELIDKYGTLPEGSVEKLLMLQDNPAVLSRKLAKLETGSKRLPSHLDGLTKAQLEGLCVDCGICCYASVPLKKGNILVPDIKCKYLSIDPDTAKSSCDVYKNRSEVAKNWCLPLPEAIAKGVFPEQCPYVKGMKDYVGSAILSEEAYSLIEPQIRKAVMEHGKPSWLSDSSWDQFAKGAYRGKGRREGTPGNYKYFYDDDGEKKTKKEKKSDREDVWGNLSLKMVKQWRSDSHRMNKLYRSIENIPEFPSPEERARFEKQFEEARSYFGYFVDNLTKWGQDHVLGMGGNDWDKQTFHAVFHTLRLTKGDMFPTQYRVFRHGREWSLRRYQKAVEEALNTVERFIANQSAEKLTRVAPQQTFNKHGVNFVVYGKGLTQGGNESDVRTTIKQFDQVNARFKELGIEKALDGLDVHVYSTFAKEAGYHVVGSDMIAGAYYPPIDRLRLFSLGLVDTGNKTLIHEIGHRVYFRLMTNTGRTSWTDSITKNKIEVKPEHIDQFISKHVEGNSYHVSAGEFIDEDKIKASVLKDDSDSKPIFEKFASSLPHTSPDEVREYLTATVEDGQMIDREFVTNYAKTNAEEMFAEAFKRYVVEGPGAVPEWTRQQLRAAMQSAGVTFKKSLNILESLGIALHTA